MKRKILALLCTMVICATGCVSIEDAPKGTSSDEKKTEIVKEEKVYLAESEIPSLFTSPDEYKDKYVSLTGKVFTMPEVSSDGITALQCWHDTENFSNNFIVYVNGTDTTFNSDEYIVVDGKVLGEFTGENLVGGTITASIIQADSIEIQSYIDAVVPTLYEMAINDGKSEQNNISISIEKVEFAEKETRFYVTETNNSESNFSFANYSAKVTQNGKQIEQDMTSMSSYNGNYEELPDELLPQISASGVLVFPAMDSSASFKFYIEGYSDNYELEFQPFTIDVAVS
ncbi:MAG: hypothetical protein EOM18_03215 [Clostridia bacterium]|nr:hypothetical protein [Clostridia bacterium]